MIMNMIMNDKVRDGNYENMKPFIICTISCESTNKTGYVYEKPPFFSCASIMKQYLIKIYRKYKKQA